MERRRRPDRRRRGDPTDYGSYFKYGAVAVFFVALAYVGYDKFVRDSDRAEDYCSRSKPPATIVTLAIDASDPFAAVQSVAIDNSIREAVGTLAQGDRLEIYEVNAAQGGLATRTFSMCNPGDATMMERFTTNPNDEEANYRRQFETSLAHALKSASNKKAAPQSPILESLRAIAASSFPPETRGARKRLILISDLVQNSPTLSMFTSGTASFGSFKGSPQYANAQADFSGVEFDLLVVLRAMYAKHQTLSLINWWEEYIRDNDGRLSGYKRI